ncbi:MAG: B12-binding domain-containing radical SAM protein [Gammaproteobacteria bacterium]
MHVTLIKPEISGKHQHFYVNAVKTEPLAIATVAGLLPDDVEVCFFDDRYEKINYDIKTDWVGITVDTYTAKRAYAIADEFRKRGVTVVLGGYHPTLLPEESEQYADAIVIGEAENIMDELLADITDKCLKKRYESKQPADLTRIKPRRDLFKGYPYIPLSVVEFGRGCKYRCDFCCIHKFYKGGYRTRPVDAVLAEIASIKNKHILFADDNLVNSPASIKPLLRGLIALKKHWGAQVTIDVAKSDEMLSLMRESGCVGLLLGLESLSNKNLKEMNKKATCEMYEQVVNTISDHHIMVNGSFVSGYAGDFADAFKDEIAFSHQHGFILAGFNHLMPLPGTALYERLQSEGRLFYKKWWLEQEDYFGSVAHQPENMTPDELALAKFNAFKTYYSLGKILRRAIKRKNNAYSLNHLLIFLVCNLPMWWRNLGNKHYALPSQINKQLASTVVNQDNIRQ